eukprot:14585517-Ditylum_brightwellii.AAC.1
MQTRAQVVAEAAKQVWVQIQSTYRAQLARRRLLKLKAAATASKFILGWVARSRTRERCRQARNLLSRNMSFILNPYDATLDLSDKEDRKMFEFGTKGLEESQQFNGKKEIFNDFAKLIGHKMKEIQ